MGRHQPARASGERVSILQFTRTRAPRSRPILGAFGGFTVQAGLLAFGSPRTLRLPAMHVDIFDGFHSGQFAEPVPDYSGGTAVDLHHLPLFVRNVSDADDRELFTCQNELGSI